jgi:hypothetical protein
MTREVTRARIVKERTKRLWKAVIMLRWVEERRRQSMNRSFEAHNRFRPKRWVISVRRFARPFKNEGGLVTRWLIIS